MAINEIHQYDAGTKFKVQVRDQDDVAVDLSPSGTELSYLFSKPDDERATKTPSFVDDGTDGWIQYVTASGDLDQVGLWRLQVYVTLVSPSGNWHSDIGTFRVWPNL